MATEFDTQDTMTDNTAEQVVTQHASAPAPVATSSSATRGKVMEIPSAKLGQIKQEQRERGKREAMAALEAQFKAFGFSSADEALAAAAAARSGGNTQQKSQQETAQAPSANAQQAQARNSKREMEKLQRERQEYQKRYAQEQAQRRRLQRQLEAKDAEMALRESAVVKGVKDVDYALRLLQRDLEGKTESELSAYDEGSFFDKLRGSHPYLFGETVVPASTGTGTNGAPPAPKAGTVQQAQGQAGNFDARTVSKEEFQKLLRQRGLNLAAS
jgi:predicted secreted protein